jgi:peroxiredoxin
MVWRRLSKQCLWLAVVIVPLLTGSQFAQPARPLRLKIHSDLFIVRAPAQQLNLQEDTMKLRIFVSVFVLLISTLAYAVQRELLTRLPEPKPAPDFTLEDTQGNTHSLSDYRGKVVILNFWATWCRPCRKEMPSMQRAWEQVRDQGVVLLAVNWEEDKETIAVFTDKYPVDFPILMDKDGSVAKQWEVKGLPTTYVIDPQGQAVYRVVGEREWDDPELLETVLALRE